MSYSITKDGKPLPKNKYKIDLLNKTFYTSEDVVMLDFSNEDGWTFQIDGSCVAITGSHCTFNTGDFCNLDTTDNCTFNTGSSCTFDVSHSCTFDVGENCVIIRRDHSEVEVIQPKDGETIELCGYGEKGFKIISPKLSLSGKKVALTIDDKTYTATID